ncbi:MAG TPA: YdcF family protein [Clostridia bacterium]|nr:YdcF family protein [Clostridia bacterium]
MESSFKNLPYGILIFLGILGVLDTVLVSIYTGMNLGTLFPGVVGSIVIIYVYIRLWVRKGKPVIQNSYARKLVTALLILGILIFISAEALIMYGAAPDAAVEAEYLIILGAGLRGDNITLVLQERLLKGIEYLERYPEADVIVTGGRGFGESITEAEAMERFLVSRGIAPERIIKEDRATSTMENFLFSRELLEKSGETDHKRITVITSDFHMLRSKLLARRAGFEPYGITCGTPISVRLNCYIREFFALVKSFFLDRV